MITSGAGRKHMNPYCCNDAEEGLQLLQYCLLEGLQVYKIVLSLHSISKDYDETIMYV